jgi:hypothetical protein
MKNTTIADIRIFRANVRYLHEEPWFRTSELGDTRE